MHSRRECEVSDAPRLLLHTIAPPDACHNTTSVALDQTHAKWFAAMCMRIALVSAAGNFA